MIRHIAAANSILLVQYAAGALIPLLLVPHIVRSIGLAEYGQLAVGLSWGSYGAVIVNYAFQLTGPVRIAQLNANESPARVLAEISLAKVILFIACVPPLISLAASGSSAASFASSPVFVVIIALPVAALLNSAWFLHAQQKFLWNSASAICATGVALWVGFKLVRGSDPNSVAAAAAATVLGPIVAGAISLVLARLLVLHQPLNWRDARPGQVLRAGLPLFSSQFLAALYASSGPIIISRLVSAEAAGAYSAVERVVNALVAAAMLTHVAAYPRLVMTYRADRSNYWRILKFVLAAYAALTCALGATAWIFIDELRLFLFGSAANDNHVPLLAWALGWLLLGVCGPAITGHLTVSGRPRDVFSLTLKILVVAIAIGVPGVLLFGSSGWMAALVLSQIVVFQAGYRLWRTERAK